MGETEGNGLEGTVVTSEMCRGNSALVIWHLKSWGEHAEFLKDNAGCIVKIPLVTEGEEEEAKEEAESAPIRLRFYLGEYECQVGARWKQWYSLWVAQLTAVGEEQNRLCFLVEVKEEEPELAGEEEENPEEDGEDDEEDDEEELEVKCQVTLEGGMEEGKVVKQKFIPMRWWKMGEQGGGRLGEEHLTEWAESEDIKLKVNVTLFKYCGGDIEDNCKENDTEEEVAEVEPPPEVAPMIKDLKAMYEREENYADITLETRDGALLNGHKFVLAARSPYFKALIDKEIMRKGFTGTIKMGNVDGKPMTVVLHWMYTDELDQENLSKVMDEVVKVSVKWELHELLKLLDKQLITVCSTKNMLHLFQVAHKNGLFTAIQDISNFIKENIDSVVPIKRADS